MKGSREYTTLCCGDSLLIALAAMRRAIREVLGLTAKDLRPKGTYGSRTIPFLIGCRNHILSGFERHLPKKILAKLDVLEDDTTIASIVELLQKLVKGNVDQVTSARIGIVLAGRVLDDELYEVACTPIVVDDEILDIARVEDVIGRMGARLTEVDHYLDQTARRVAAAVDREFETRLIEVVNHDLTAPVLIISPADAKPLFKPNAIKAVSSHAVALFAHDHFYEITELVASELEASPAIHTASRGCSDQA